MLVILSSLYLLISNFAHAEDLICDFGKIRLFEFEQSKIEHLYFCFNSSKNNFMSKSCYEKKCTALNFEDTNLTLEELLSPMGKPGFKLCRNIGGKPELVEFYINKVFYKLDRCLFKDGNFVDTDYLVYYYFERS